MFLVTVLFASCFASEEADVRPADNRFEASGSLLYDPVETRYERALQLPETTDDEKHIKDATLKSLEEELRVKMEFEKQKELFKQLKEQEDRQAYVEERGKEFLSLYESQSDWSESESSEGEYAESTEQEREKEKREAEKAKQMKAQERVTMTAARLARFQK